MKYSRYKDWLLLFIFIFCLPVGIYLIIKGLANGKTLSLANRLKWLKVAIIFMFIFMASAAIYVFLMGGKMIFAMGSFY